MNIGLITPNGQLHSVDAARMLDKLSRQLGKEISFFKCRRCGECCRDFGGEGVWLLPEETSLFPRKSVEPYLGIRKGGTVEVKVYILRSEPCPRLVDGHSCGIYRQRPLLCRIYPLKPGDNGVIYMGDDCPNRISFPTREMLVAFRNHSERLLFLETMGDRAVGLEGDRWIPVDEFFQRVRDKLKVSIVEWEPRAVVPFKAFGLPPLCLFIPEVYF